MGKAFGPLARVRAERRQRGGICARDTRHVHQTAVGEAHHTARRLLDVRRNRTRRDDDAAVELCARRQLLGEARLAAARFGFDHQEREPAGARQAPLRERGRHVALAAEERRAPPRDAAIGGERVLREMPGARAAESLDQRDRLRLPARVAVALRRLRELLERAQRPRSIAGGREPPQVRSQGTLGARVHPPGFHDGVIRARLVTGIEALLSMTQQRVHGAAVPM